MEKDNTLKELIDHIKVEVETKKLKGKLGNKYFNANIVEATGFKFNMCGGHKGKGQPGKEEPKPKNGELKYETKTKGVVFQSQLARTYSQVLPSTKEIDQRAK